MNRSIVSIDEELCNGCGDCIPACHEGALQIIEGKARLVSDFFCDGLGACLGVCPVGAITIEEREAEGYDERKVMEQIVPKGAATVAAHLEHLIEHGELEFYRQAVEYLEERGLAPAAAPSPCASAFAAAPGLDGGCPGSRVTQLSAGAPVALAAAAPASAQPQTRLGTWPIQLSLVPVQAPFFSDAHLLVAADCVPFAHAGFHDRFLDGRVLVIGCPKLDDIDMYAAKLSAIFRHNEIRSVTVARMEVPCCTGIVRAVQVALAGGGKPLPFTEAVVAVDGTLRE